MRKNQSKAAVTLVGILGMAVSLGMMQIPEARHLKTSPTNTKPPKLSNPPSAKPSSRATLVAVIDTGIDVSHPKLKSRIWINQGESGIDEFGSPKETNGIDDDGNGYIDDVHGYDFTQLKDATTDSHGHGTHIAGIISQESKSENVRFISLVYYRNGISGDQALKNSISAVRYAIKMNADIINYSGGGSLPNAEERAVFEEANRRGILVVAAAGNEASNSEKLPFFPANYGLPNILSVTATNGQSPKLLPSSNFGQRSVAVAAPGKDIMSTLPGGSYGEMTGTSQATAFVSGSAVRVLSAMMRQSAKPSPELIIEKLVGAGSVSLELKGKTRLSTHLNRKEVSAIIAKKPQYFDRPQASREFERALRQEISAGHGLF